MHNEDDFFLAFKEKVARDVENILGISSEPLEIFLSFSTRRIIYTWKDLPAVCWSYKIYIPEEKLTSDYGGYMVLQGGNWPDFQRHIMEELQEYIKVRDARQKLKENLGNMKLEISNWQEAGPFLYRPRVGNKREEIATLPVAAERDNDN